MSPHLVKSENGFRVPHYKKLPRLLPKRNGDSELQSEPVDDHSTELGSFLELSRIRPRMGIKHGTPSMIG